MLQLQGKVANILVTPEGKNREGQEYGGIHQVQLLCEEVLRNGEKRLALFTLRCDHPEAFKPFAGQEVRVPVGVFVKGNALTFYMQKSGAPEPVNARRA